MARLSMSSSEAGFACDSLPDSAVLPSLVVFDLDHTLWTPGMCVVLCTRECIWVMWHVCGVEFVCAWCSYVRTCHVRDASTRKVPEYPYTCVLKIQNFNNKF